MARLLSHGFTVRPATAAFAALRMGHAHTQAFGLARGISFAFPGDVHLRHNQHGRQQFPDLLHERQELPFTVQRHLGIQRPADHFLRPCGFQRLLHVVPSVP